MILVKAKVEDFDRFWNVFSTKGAEKRKQHGCRGATLYRDPDDENTVWGVFDWDDAGWQSYVADPDVPAIFQDAGMLSRPSPAVFVRTHDS